MIDKKTHFEEIIKSGKLLNIELFNINDSYFEIENSDLWLIDGAIQLTFPSGIIQIGWSEDHDLFFTTHKDLKLSNGELTFKELTEGKISKIHNLRGKRVVDFELRWIPFEIWDDESDDFKETQTLMEMILEFDSKEKIQFATVNYDFNPDEDPVNFTFDLVTELLISLQEKIEIKLHTST